MSNNSYKNLALRVSGIVFGLVALLHLIRIIHGTNIIYSTHIVSMEVSYIGFVLALVLAIWMFVASSK